MSRLLLPFALCLLLTSCRRPIDMDQARSLVLRYNEIVSEAYRRADIKLIDSVVGPNESKKLTGLIGVRLAKKRCNMLASVIRESLSGSVHVFRQRPSIQQ